MNYYLKAIISLLLLIFSINLEAQRVSSYNNIAGSVIGGPSLPTSLNRGENMFFVVMHNVNDFPITNVRVRDVRFQNSGNYPVHIEIVEVYSEVGHPIRHIGIGKGLVIGIKINVTTPNYNYWQSIPGSISMDVDYSIFMQPFVSRRTYTTSWDVSINPIPTLPIADVDGVSATLGYVSSTFEQVTVKGNPFYINTAISYQLAQTEAVAVSVYDMTGKRIRTLFEGMQEEGEHELTLDGGDLEAGVYYIVLTNGKTKVSKKIVRVD
ncbi:MAG: T9SS type A sorting domain-containing protein [Bacteroidota bacterium]